MSTNRNNLKNRTAELIGSAAMRLGDGSSVVEQVAVNHPVGGSIPSRFVSYPVQQQQHQPPTYQPVGV